MTDTMEIKVSRYAMGPEATAGALYVDGAFFCYTLEDQVRDGPKVAGETAIPCGRYEIKLRDAGGMNKRYSLSPHYADFHRGMLHLQNVPGFSWIYIHPGNNDDHTEGCILVGYGASKKGEDHVIWNSRDAYKALYLAICAAMDEGKSVFVTVE